MQDLALGHFLFVSIIAVICIAITSIIAYEVIGWTWNKLPHLRIAPRIRVLLIIAPIFAIHIVNIWMYAGLYFVIENFAELGRLTGHIEPAAVSFRCFIGRLYYSASTYTSLGLGDITPTDSLRMITSAEVLNGLVSIGWTISFTYLAMEKFWAKSK